MSIQRITESMRLLAQSLSSLAYSASQAKVMSISTAAVLQASFIPASILGIRTFGFSTVGDGGDALYMRVTSGADITSADGAGWAVTSTGSGQFVWSGGNDAAVPLASPGTYCPVGTTGSQTNPSLFLPQRYTVRKFATRLFVAPGGGNTRTFDLAFNGVASGTYAITYGAADSGFKSVSAVTSHAENVTIYVSSTATGAPAASDGTWAMTLVPTQAV